MNKILIRKICLTSLLLAVYLNTIAQMNKISDQLPDQVHTWVLAEHHTYTPDNLFEYINGGAELYKSFGFTTAESRIYKSEGQPDIILDLFDMNTAVDAYGVFTFSAEYSDSSFGQGAQYGEGFLLFWMDRFFVSVMSYPETPQSAEAIKLLGKTVESLINTKGQLPHILNYLPKTGLMAGSIRYFHHPAWLNSHYFIATGNIFLINDKTDVVLAKYTIGTKNIILLLIEYPREELAEAGYSEFKKQYFKDKKGVDVIRIEDNSYTGCLQNRNFIVSVFNVNSADQVSSLMEEVITLYNQYQQ